MVFVDVFQSILDKDITHISMQDLYDRLIQYGHLSSNERYAIRIVHCPHCQKELEPNEYSAIHLYIEEPQNTILHTEIEKAKRSFLRILHYDIHTICPYCYKEIMIKNQTKTIIVAPDPMERSTTIERT